MGTVYSRLVSGCAEETRRATVADHRAEYIATFQPEALICTLGATRRANEPLTPLSPAGKIDPQQSRPMLSWRTRQNANLMNCQQADSSRNSPGAVPGRPCHADPVQLEAGKHRKPVR